MSSRELEETCDSRLNPYRDEDAAKVVEEMLKFLRDETPELHIKVRGL